MVAHRLAPFGTTIFSEMTALAQRHGAINLSQGFPDFEGPREIVEAATTALRGGHNQYARSMGHPRLARAIAERQRDLYGLDYDPDTEVTVCCGATEGIAASMLGLLDPGDEVILLEPFYDSYPACVALAGGVPRYLKLPFPDFTLDAGALAELFTERTRLLVLNTPHNPTGKVFGRAELETVAELARRHDVVVLADEVYEHLTYEGARHLPIASLPGMRERTLTLSSTGKSFSFTGWKIGWAVGPAPLVAAAQAAHQFLTFCVPPALQLAMAEALERFRGDYFQEFRAAYRQRRDVLVEALQEVGFEVAMPQGTYFVLADITPLWDGDDRGFAHHLVERCGVATIPVSVFYHQPEDEDRRLLRFAFCKRLETLRRAAEALMRLDHG